MVATHLLHFHFRGARDQVAAPTPDIRVINVLAVDRDIDIYEDRTITPLPEDRTIEVLH